MQTLEKPQLAGFTFADCFLVEPVEKEDPQPEMEQDEEKQQNEDVDQEFKSSKRGRAADDDEEAEGNKFWTHLLYLDEERSSPTKRGRKPESPAPTARKSPQSKVTNETPTIKVFTILFLY